ncbi:hypothetical protein UlMin_023384 [Ulmus minor]
MYLDSAFDMWSDLYDRFHQGNNPRVFQIKQLLDNLVQGSNDVSGYFTRLRTLWEELKDFRPFLMCSCRAMKKLIDLQQHDYVLQFLMGLNESFSQVRAQILMLDPLPSINKVFSLIVQDERQRSLSSLNLCLGQIPYFLFYPSSGTAGSMPQPFPIRVHRHGPPRGFNVTTRSKGLPQVPLQ